METKEQIIERLIKDGHISFKEGMTLMGEEPKNVFYPTYYHPYTPPSLPTPWWGGTYCNDDSITHTQYEVTC